MNIQTAKQSHNDKQAKVFSTFLDALSAGDTVRAREATQEMARAIDPPADQSAG